MVQQGQIDHLLQETSQILPPPALVQQAFLQDFDAAYKASMDSPEDFWEGVAKELSWIKPWDKVFEWDYPTFKWFLGAKCNITQNALDRHLTNGNKNKAAFIWLGEDGSERVFTYGRLAQMVNRLANGLRSLGIGKGDRVVIYMPLTPEGAIAMLACARIGAVHSVVFGGFSPDALASRVEDCGARLVITADEAPRGGRNTALKANADKALAKLPGVKLLVVRRTGGEIAWDPDRDTWLHEAEAVVSADCPAEEMSAEDPLFILYTSGSTGQPKGVLHSTGGYLVYASMTHEYVFDYHDGDIYWCTADVGWVTGHTYIVYGPLANGATTVMFEGVPNYPDAARFWQVCDKFKVNIFYTAPTAIRALMGAGDEFVTKPPRKSIRPLGTVGEPINPEAWMWEDRVTGEGRCPIVDTGWQTETGGILITPLPGATPLKPGSCTRPFCGIQPVVIDKDGNEVEGPGEGALCMRDSWPGQMRTLYGDHDRFVKTYFSTPVGKYFTSDGCRRDEDGYYWITGRVDDVINVSGHRMGTAEVESALVVHPDVAEAAVVGYPHHIKGQGIYAYVTLNAGVQSSDNLRKELVLCVRKEIGPIASPDLIQFAPGLPKTRSGKIMRRILRKIAEDDFSNLGDTSTLAEPAVVDDLIENRMNR